jgi:hypothetical protein
MSRARFEALARALLAGWGARAPKNSAGWGARAPKKQRGLGRPRSTIQRQNGTADAADAVAVIPNPR